MGIISCETLSSGWIIHYVNFTFIKLNANMIKLIIAVLLILAGCLWIFLSSQVDIFKIIIGSMFIIAGLLSVLSYYQAKRSSN